MPDLSPLLRAPAQAVANAEVELARRQDEVIAATRTLDAIEGRMRSIDSKRAAIAARRAQGDTRTGDAGEIALLDMDRAALAAELAKADEAVATPRVALAEAQRRLSFAKGEMTRAEARLILEALLDHASAVSAALTATLKEMAAVGERVGRLDYRWQPPAELVALLRRCEFAGRPG